LIVDPMRRIQVRPSTAAVGARRRRPHDALAKTVRAGFIDPDALALTARATRDSL
jgi:hypothetical protein